MESEPIPSSGPATRFALLKEWAYNNSGYFFILISVLLVIDVGYWSITHALALWGGRPRWLPLVPTSVTAEIGLALGTFTLAAAAMIQEKVAEDADEVSRIQSKAAQSLTDAAERRARVLREQSALNLRPSIATQFVGVSNRLRQPPEPRILSPGDLMRIGSEDSALYVHNAGPGVAWDLEVAVTALGPIPAMDGKHLSQAQRTVPMLGISESSQVTYPGPLFEALWPGRAVGAKFAILFDVTAQEADFALEPEAPPPDF